MIDDIEDATDRTKGTTLYEGTARFLAEGDEYASQTWRFRADDETGALETLDRLSDGCMYADPRIDYVRDFEVEEQADVLDEDGEPVGA
jgi:hypothetical protein